jgi:NAD(P)-dependent dehydrogenase (short-subunit alcohol dehydrogenase family)
MRLKAVEEQVVVLMGASSGIGRETALQFAKRGAKVVVSARGQEGLDEQPHNDEQRPTKRRADQRYQVQHRNQQRQRGGIGHAKDQQHDEGDNTADQADGEVACEVAADRPRMRPLFLKSAQSACSWEKAKRPSVHRNRSFSSS